MSTGWRRVGVLSLDGAPPEHFDIRISEEGFEEWLEDRERLRRLPDSPPDRPPDVDSESLRAWLPHPGEEDHPYFASHPAPSRSEPEAVFPVLSISWRATNGRLKVLVVSTADGEFEAEVQSDVGIGFHRQYPKEMSATAVGIDFEESLQALVERLPDDPDIRVQVTTYADYIAFDAELMLAEADIARGFINPVTTDEVIQ